VTRIRFGFIFDFCNPPEWQVAFPKLYAETLELIAWLETIGFDAVWIAEHHGVEDGYMPSPLVIGAAIAARTRTMRISPGVALAPFYHPVRLAEDAAVLDNISGGRAELALGIGYRQAEADSYGAPFNRRGRYTDEVLQIIAPLLAGETIDFDGEFFQLKNARVFPRPVQQPRIPILVGGIARPGLRRAARFGDGLCGGVNEYPAYIEERRALGKMDNPRLDCMTDMWTVVSDDPERTMNEIAPHYCYQLAAYAGWQAGTGWDYLPADASKIRESGAFQVLTPDQAVALIAKRKAQVPELESFCMMVPAGLPLGRLTEHAKLFAEKVIPAFR
jgi:alkanesulfonate monooxygenase SsuD/methylene tetrahydromethanopterin reductase-like flavin-dependent oxidoreductase (luciferase family)